MAVRFIGPLTMTIHGPGGAVVPGRDYMSKPPSMDGERPEKLLARYNSAVLEAERAAQASASCEDRGPRQQAAQWGTIFAPLNPKPNVLSNE